MPVPVEEFKVTKTANAAPRTPTYKVDPIEGEYTFTVSILDDKPTCWQHGTHCDHAKAVVLHLAKKKR